MDYRSLVHEKDETIFSEIRVIVLDIRGFYVSQIYPNQNCIPSFCHRGKVKPFSVCLLKAELYDIISKNLEKVTNPKGEEKPSMYWSWRKEEVGRILQSSVLHIGTMQYKSAVFVQSFSTVLNLSLKNKKTTTGYMFWITIVVWWHFGFRATLALNLRCSTLRKKLNKEKLVFSNCFILIYLKKKIFLTLFMTRLWFIFFLLKQILG